MFGPQSAGTTSSAAVTGEAPSSSLTTGSPGSETAIEGALVETNESNAAREEGSRAVEWAADDDLAAEPRIPWALIVLMSYSSAVTLALTWVLWAGRSYRATELQPPV